MILLRNLKAGFEKKAKYPCDCDGYRPDTLGGGIGIRSGFVTWPEVMIETIAPIFVEEI